MKKYLLCIMFSVVFVLYNCAQPLHINTYDLGSLSLKQPILVGKVGNSFMLYDIPERKGFPLFILDSNLQLITKVYLPEDAYVGKMRVVNDALRISWYTSISASNDKADLTEMKMIQVNEDGQIQSIENNLFRQFMRSSSQLPRFVSDKFRNRELIYSFKVDSMHVFLEGLIIDSAGRVAKELAHEFELDPEQSQQPLVQLDSKGNVHIIVLNRLSAYSMSTSLTVNTIPFRSDSIVSESFKFDRVKFNQLVPVDDPVQERISLRGFYYNGEKKNSKKGLASLGFPYVRGGAPITIFNPFPDTLRQQLRQGMRHIRAKDDVMNSIIRKDVVEQGSRTFMSYWVYDISELDLPSDFDADKASTALLNQTGTIYSAGNMGQTETLNRWLNDAAQLGTQLSVVPQRYVLPENIPNQYPVFSDPSLVTPVVGNGLSYREYNSIMLKMDEWKTGKLKNKRKLFCFSIDSTGKVQEYRVIGYDFFQETAGANLPLVTYPVHDDKSLYYTGNPSSEDREIEFTLVKPVRNIPILIQQPVPYSKQPFLVGPVQTGRKQYASLARINPGNQYSLFIFELP